MPNSEIRTMDLTLGIIADSRFFRDQSGLYCTDSNIRKKYLYAVADQFKQLVLFVRVSESTLEEFPDSERIGCKNIRFVDLPAFNGPLGFLRHRRTIAGIIQKHLFACDVVNARFGFMIPGLGSRLASIAGIPVLAAVIGDVRGVVKTEKRLVPVPLLRTIVANISYYRLKRMVGRCDVVLGVSAAIAKKYAAPGQPWHVVTDTCLDESSYCEARPRLSHQAMRFIFAGRVWQSKNCQTFIRGLAQAIARGARCEAVVVGDGPYLPVLVDLARKLGIASYVQFPGRTDSRDRLNEYYRSSHAGFLVSYSEGLGLGAVEPMAMGLPVIVSDMPPFDEFVEDGVQGFRVGVEDAEAIARRILELESNEPLRMKMGQEAHRTAQRYSIREQVKRLAAATAEAYWNGRDRR